MRCTHRRSNLLLAGFALLLAACADPIEPGRSLSPDPRLAKAATTTDPTVTSALPSEAPQDTTLDVQINGSGFDRGTIARFERNGTVDARVHVNSTRYLKSTQLVANLTIALDATVSPYDVVVVTASGKKGIGTEAFTVRMADPLPTWTIDAANSLNFADDGRGDYVSGQCGITGLIFYGNYDPATGTGGDVTLGNIRPGSTGCLPRAIRVTLNGVSRNVPFLAIRTIVGLSVGESHTRNFVIQVDGDSRCTRVGWWTVAEGGAGGQITVKRTASDTWSATTAGSARCFYFRGQTRVWGTTFMNVQASFMIKQQP